MPDSWLIIGGGIVGLATAYELSQARPTARITLLEKEAETGLHQSSHNSGVLHAGLYYRPGSLKARLAVAGIKRMTEFCRQHEIRHEICGKLVVATDERQREQLQELQRRGNANGLQGLRWLEPAGWRDIEPQVQGLAALHVPQEGIVDYRQVTRTLTQLLEARGVRIVTGARVMRLTQHAAGEWLAHTQAAGTHSAQGLINCAGLYCDRVARLAGENSAVRIVPFRGEYYRLRPSAEPYVNHLVYPVPDPVYPFLGVHFTRLIGGGVECGPNAVLALSREGYNWRQVNLRDSVEVAAFPGFWRFLYRHRAQAFSELRGSFSKERFCDNLKKLIPSVTPDDLAPGGSGVRAQAMNSRGDLLADFEVVHGPRALHVLNAPSPAATASLAIGRHLVQLLG